MPIHVQHIFNTFSTPFQHIFNTFSTHFQHIFNTFSTHFQHLFNTFSTPFQHIFNTFSTHFQHIFNTFSTHFQHIFNTCSTHLQDPVNICSSHFQMFDLIMMFLTPDLFKTYPCHVFMLGNVVSHFVRSNKKANKRSTCKSPSLGACCLACSQAWSLVLAWVWAAYIWAALVLQNELF